MRARMFRDDLQRVVDEIENSEVMWLGITRGIHGYDEIDIDDKVSVHSEVARLTRLYDKAVRSNDQNSPDLYMAGGGVDSVTGLRSRQGTQGQVLAIIPPVVPPPAAAVQPAASGAAPVTEPDLDESPASAKPEKVEKAPVVTEESGKAKEEGSKDSKEEANGKAQEAKEPAPPEQSTAGPAKTEGPHDPDEEPATHPAKRSRASTKEAPKDEANGSAKKEADDKDDANGSANGKIKKERGSSD